MVLRKSLQSIGLIMVKRCPAVGSSVKEAMTRGRARETRVAAWFLERTWLPPCGRPNPSLITPTWLLAGWRVQRIACLDACLASGRFRGTLEQSDTTLLCGNFVHQESYWQQRYVRALVLACTASLSSPDQCLALSTLGLREPSQKIYVASSRPLVCIHT